MQARLHARAVIRRVFEIYVAEAAVLMPAAAVVFVFTGVLSTVLARSGLALLSLIISFVATTVFTGMVVELVADVQDGRRDATPRQLLRAVSPVIGKLIAVGFVAGIGIGIGFILLIVPGLLLITIWAVAAPVVVLEKPPGLGALDRSLKLVKGQAWQVFLVIFSLYIVIALLVGAADVGAESAGTGAGVVVRVVLGVLSAPLPALAAAVLYFELLPRRSDPGELEPPVASTPV